MITILWGNDIIRKNGRKTRNSRKPTFSGGGRVPLHVAVVAVDFLVDEKIKKKFLFIYIIYIIYNIYK